MIGGAWDRPQVFRLDLGTRTKLCYSFVMSPSIPPYDPGTIEAPGLPKVEVFFDPPVKIPEEQDPKVLAQVAQVAQLAGALASVLKSGD